ncbi:MAG: amidohydrolase [Acidibacter sp.]|nr:amidohydrolase [Acidibacter sp.]
MAGRSDPTLSRSRLTSWQRGLLAALLIATAALQAAVAAPTLYVGRIITMDPSQPFAEAVLVEGERIVAVGGKELRKAHEGDARVVELGRRAMLPGFIDAHGHLTATAAYINFVNLSPPPVGPVADVARLQTTLREHIERERIPAGRWVVGVGYDDSLLKEKRHPTRDDLDVVSREHPIFIVHVSGHLSVGNSALLSQVGISSETVDPPGGAYRRRADSREPNGVFEEMAHYAVMARLPRPNPDGALIGLQKTLAYLASRGLTTVQDGGANTENLQLLQSAAQNGLLNLDVVAYRYWSPIGMALPKEFVSNEYQNRFRVDGVKIILDGSPQGKTAFLSRPYTVPPVGRDASYRGYPSLPEPVVQKAVTAALQARVPLLAHANGDAAAEILIDAVDAAAVAEAPRVVMIHSQTVRDDQLDRMARLRITPSFFVSHTFFWGDWHREETLGVERAIRISPTRSATERGIRYTLHNDPPVVPPDMIRTLWSATTRRTRSGEVLGREQRASTHEALAGITLDAARQYGEEASKGSISAGKQADFVIVDQDPLAMDPENLLQLQVLETISRGKTVFLAP